MKINTARYLRGRMEGIASQRIESRDGQLYDVTPSARTCRVKIQGTPTLVVAHYPENWSQTPEWLKPGNAVRISHTGGNRGRIELVGHGALIPTPVSGDSGDPAYIPPDVIINGLTITPDGGMDVAIASGNVRFDGVTSEVSATTKTWSTAPLPPPRSSPLPRPTICSSAGY